MSFPISDVQSALTKNRAEELGEDVWEHFVVPLFLDQIDLTTAAKPRILIGGRGCGKTMLLRYFAHPSRFSPSRAGLSPSELKHIGLYWRADTQFVNAMTGRSVEDDVWESAFGHSLAIGLALEITSSIELICKSALGSTVINDVEALKFDALSSFGVAIQGTVADVRLSLQRLEWEFQAWLNNPRGRKPPIFLPGREFPKAIVGILRDQVRALKDTSFAVYIDEYENLRKYQQRILNTYLKHSESPLVFHLAMKRNGMQTKETLGEESITDIADYRTIDLDQLLQDHAFEVFAAEILLLRFASISGFSTSVSIETLKDPTALAERRSTSYRAKVLSKVNAIFPGLSAKELADVVFAEAALLEQLKRSIGLALRRKASRMRPEQFIRDDHRQAAIITPALLYRSDLSPEVVLAELKLLEQGKENRFTGKTNWIHNNYEGCLLFLYAPFDRTCPFYAGFDTFVQLSQSNLRHFLELCYKALKRLPEGTDASQIVVPPREQGEAAKQASAAFITEIKGFGRLGNRLHTFVLTLGSLFALSQRRPSQSEPEISHFSIVGGDASLSVEDEDFFKEAVKWSVLIDYPQTKLKDPLRPFGSDWVLNPIYSPYFHITYRKRRKLDLKVEDVTVLIRGTYDESRAFLKRYFDRWSVDLAEAQPSLFAHLDL